MLSEIYRVDIEFHSKCNRQCEWCPNKFLDRHSTDEIFDKELFIKLMRDLYDNGFGKKSAYGSNFTQAIISFLGYQEPFLQPELSHQSARFYRKLLRFFQEPSCRKFQ